MGTARIAIYLWCAKILLYDNGTTKRMVDDRLSPATTSLPKRPRATSGERPSVAPFARATAMAPRRNCMRVMILGMEYTMLTWYLQKKPNDSQCRKVMSLRSKHAAELENGDHKTSTKREFAKVAPAEVPDLWLPNRKQFPSTFKDTNCATAEGWIRACTKTWTCVQLPRRPLPL